MNKQLMIKTLLIAAVPVTLLSISLLSSGARAEDEKLVSHNSVDTFPQQLLPIPVNPVENFNPAQPDQTVYAQPTVKQFAQLRIECPGEALISINRNQMLARGYHRAYQLELVEGARYLIESAVPSGQQMIRTQKEVVVRNGKLSHARLIFDAPPQRTNLEQVAVATGPVSELAQLLANQPAPAQALRPTGAGGTPVDAGCADDLTVGPVFSIYLKGKPNQQHPSGDYIGHVSYVEKRSVGPTGDVTTTVHKTLTDFEWELSSSSRDLKIQMDGTFPDSLRDHKPKLIGQLIAVAKGGRKQALGLQLELGETTKDSILSKLLRFPLYHLVPADPAKPTENLSMQKTDLVKKIEDLISDPFYGVPPSMDCEKVELCLSVQFNQQRYRVKDKVIIHLHPGKK